MNWRLILQLSLFGLAMGLATVFFVPASVEPAVWLVIFVICAYVLAGARSGRPFLHGLCVGIANSVWISAAHMALADRYLAGHVREATILKSMPWPDAPRAMMAMTGPLIGVASGILIGLLALLATRCVRRGS